MNFVLYTFSQFYSTSGQGAGCVESGIFSDEFIKQSVVLLVAKIREKYRDARISPEYSLNITKRENDDFITVSGEFCLGDGDYVKRAVHMPLPEIEWGVAEKGVQLSQRLGGKP